MKVEGIMFKRRNHLNTVLSSGKINDSQMLEVMIRLVFHDDGSPRTVNLVTVREILMKHPYFDLILKEGVDDGEEV